VFSLGDASSLPTSKTGAAIRKQAPVTVKNVLALVDGKPLDAQYNGYTSCPLVTSYTRLMLAEFDYDGNAHQAGLLNIFGGKLTTYRRLAENALEEIKPKLPDLEGSWTSHSPLPGGNFPVEEIDALIESTEKEYPLLDRRDALRLVHTYGTEVNEILENARNWEDLGKQFGAGLTEAEVKYLQRNEWALTAEDILWRRTKLGLRFSHEEENGLSEWLRDSSHAIVQAPKASATRVL